MTDTSNPHREDYATRKEYRWAVKNAKRAHAQASAAWRYPAAFLAVVAGYIAHNVIVGLVVGAVAAAVFAAKLRSHRAQEGRNDE